MGAGASSKGGGGGTPSDMKEFTNLKQEYEEMIKKDESDEVIFNKMKTIITEKSKNTQNEDGKKKRTNIFSKGLDVENRVEVGEKNKDNDDEEDERNKKTGECTDLLKRALQTLLFEESGDSEIDMVISVMTKVEVGVSDYVIHQGDSGDKFYVVEHGTLDFVINGNIVGSVQGGGHFGELALIYDAPRSASVRATTPAILWTLGRDDFRTIQAQTSSDSLVRRSRWLQKVPILERLSARQLSLLAGSLEAVRYNAGEVIITQGTPGDVFYLIEEGTVSCKMKETDGDNSTVVANLCEGDYFGEQALLNDQPRNASIVAESKEVKCLKLERREFDSMLGPLSGLLENNANKRIFRMFPIFKEIPDTELEGIIAMLEPVEFPDTGTHIFEDGDVCDAFYIIKSGKISLKNSISSSELSMGEYFGKEMLLVNDCKNFTSTATTASDNVQVVRLTRDGLKIAREASSQHTSDNNSSVSSTTQDSVHELANVEFKELVQIGVLGEGSFGKVSMVQAFVNEREYILALKCMSKAHLVECNQEAHVMREKQIMSTLPPHPFIVRLYATHQNQNYLYMLMDLVQGGELFGLLYDEENSNNIGDDGICFYAANVYLALEHLHKRDIAYRDLKPENLLIDTDGHLKLVDMGFCKTIPFTVTNDRGIEETHSRSYTLCGTQEYLAPEFVLNTGHDLAVDYWAFGILLYEMLLGYTPFEAEDGDIATLFKNIAFVRTGANKVEFPSDLEERLPHACDLIKLLLHGDAGKRLGVGINGASEIRTHPFFASIDWEKLVKLELETPYKPKVSGKYDLSLFEGDQGLRANDVPYDSEASELFEGF